MKAKPETIPEGSHVHLLTNGQHTGSGVIDMWMPDGSAFWIWLDHGAGKRLVHKSDAVDAVVCTPDPDGARADTKPALLGMSGNLDTSCCKNEGAHNAPSGP